MKLLNPIVIALIICLFFSCSSAYKLEKQSPLKFHKIEVKKWVIDNKSRDSGMNMYMVLPSNVKVPLDSVYYNNARAKISKGKHNNTYFAKFLSRSQKKYGYKKYPFVLKNNECVISYTQKGKTKYYKYPSVKLKL